MLWQRRRCAVDFQLEHLAERAGHWLFIEITETDLVADLDRALDALDALRTLGIHLAIDDFGVGESSLANLHRYPVDVVKIDRLFINRLDDGADGRNMTKAVIDLAHAMGVRALAEGVETPAQAAMLRDLHADLTQGYLFSRPQRAQVIEAILADPDTFRTTNQTHLSCGTDLLLIDAGGRADRSVPPQLTSRNRS